MAIGKSEADANTAAADIRAQMRLYTHFSPFQVTKAHAGDYTCTPYNTHGTSGTSGVMQVTISSSLTTILLFPKVHVRDPPTIKLRPEDEYMKSVGEKVTFPCSASGSPAPTITWRRPDGYDLPKKRHKEYQGTLTISGLQKKDHGIYECVVSGGFSQSHTLLWC